MVTADIHLHEGAEISGDVLSNTEETFAIIYLANHGDLRSHIYPSSPDQLDEIAATATRLANELRAAQAAKTEAA